MTDRTSYIYWSFSKYSKSIRKNNKNNTENLRKYYSLMNDFLNRFDWILSYNGTDILNQEKNGNNRFTGVCYDACKYLAQKLEKENIEYKSYWIGGYGKDTIKNWLSGDSLHSFNVCKIDGIYYFADNYFSPILLSDDTIYGFIDEKIALSWAAESIFDNTPYMLREYNPIASKTDSHILLTIRRLLNLKD